MNRQGLPSALRERVFQMQKAFSMGCLLDARLAFAVVDNALFLWPLEPDMDTQGQFYTPDDGLLFFETIQETILAVGCVPPLPGIPHPLCYIFIVHIYLQLCTCVFTLCCQ